MSADPRYIVQPLLQKGQSVILFSPDSASGLLFAQQLAADIQGGNKLFCANPHRESPTEAHQRFQLYA